jgi:ABC-type nitrate/sulfonate/bicarbonate transport system substrate-binding protein
MSVSRRRAVASLAALALLAAPAASGAETIRVGLPTKTYWPTTIAETAVRQKLFEKEGITAELTIYRSGAETFEGMAAGAADIILDPPSLVSAGRKKGVMSRIVANAAMGNFGWQLMVPTKSTLDVRDLNGKKVAITAAGSGSTCWRSGPSRTGRSISPACRSAAAAWCPIFSPAMSRRRWSIRRSASRFRNRARPAPSSIIRGKCRRT